MNNTQKQNAILAFLKTNGAATAKEIKAGVAGLTGEEVRKFGKLLLDAKLVVSAGGQKIALPAAAKVAAPVQAAAKAKLTKKVATPEPEEYSEEDLDSFADEYSDLSENAKTKADKARLAEIEEILEAAGRFDDGEADGDDDAEAEADDDAEADEAEAEADDEADGETDEEMAAFVAEYEELSEMEKTNKAQKARLAELEAYLTEQGMFEDSGDDDGDDGDEFGDDDDDEHGDDDGDEFGDDDDDDEPAPAKSKSKKAKPAGKEFTIAFKPINTLDEDELETRIAKSLAYCASIEDDDIEVAEMLYRSIVKAKKQLGKQQA